MTRLHTLQLKFKFNNAYHQYNKKNKKKGERWRDIAAVSFHKANLYMHYILKKTLDYNITKIKGPSHSQDNT